MQKKVKQSLLIMGAAVVCSHTMALQPLTEQEMANTIGQSLFSMSNTAPNSSGIGFTTIGLQADLAINGNIKSLRLGCDGPNGTGACDISIDNMSISGNPGVDSSGNVIANNPNNLPATDAIMHNPYLNFAFKNPNSASTREFVGLRFGAAAINGLLQLGNQDDASTDGDHIDPRTGTKGTAGNGLNTLSGYMKTADTPGTATTVPGLIYNEISQGNMVGKMCAIGFVVNGSCFGATLALKGTFVKTVSPQNHTPTGDGIVLPSVSTNYVVPSQTVVGKRISSIFSPVNIVINNLPLKGNIGNVTSNVTSPLPMTVDNTIILDGVLNNLHANIAFQEDLSYIHKIPLSGNGLNISIQKQNILWPGGMAPAQAGWWMETSGVLNIGRMDAATPLDVSTLFPQINNVLTKYFTDNPMDIGTLSYAQVLNLNPVYVPAFTLDLDHYTDGSMGANYGPLVKSVSNAKLAGQNTISNCWVRNFC